MTEAAQVCPSLAITVEVTTPATTIRTRINLARADITSSRRSPDGGVTQGEPQGRGYALPNHTGLKSAVTTLPTDQ